MQNLERRNNFYDSNPSYISTKYQSNQNYKNSSRLYNRMASPYFGNTPTPENAKNTKSPKISHTNYNQNQLIHNKQNLPSNIYNTNFSKLNSQSNPSLNYKHTPKYFSPFPIYKSNNENINYSNLNQKPITSIKNPNNINMSNNNTLNIALQGQNYNLKKTIKKKTLILDLDETLVHSGFHPFNRKSDFTLNITVEGKNHTIYVLKRPYVDEFLSEISPFFDIIIFTASISEYASPLLDELDKDKLTYGRKFRQDCLFNNGLYLKDLKNIGKDLKDVIIIDNNPVSYALNQDNGIPILTWYEDLNDEELINLIPLLKYLSTVDDVRPIIRRIVNMQKNEIKFDVVEELIKDKINENNNYKKMIYETNDNYNEDEVKNEYEDNKKDDYININNFRNENEYGNHYKNEKTDKYESNKYFNNNDKLSFLNNNNKNNYYVNYKNQNENINNNKYRNYLVNENLYKYNNNIHDSLSNMSYNEIQNEGKTDNINNNDLNIKRNQEIINENNINKKNYECKNEAYNIQNYNMHNEFNDIKRYYNYNNKDNIRSNSNEYNINNYDNRTSNNEYNNQNHNIKRNNQYYNYKNYSNGNNIPLIKKDEIMDNQINQNELSSEKNKIKYFNSYNAEDINQKYHNILNNENKMDMNMNDNYQEQKKPNNYYNRSFTPNINMQKKSISFYNNRKNGLNNFNSQKLIEENNELFNKEYNIEMNNQIKSNESEQINDNKNIIHFNNNRNNNNYNDYLKTNNYLIKNDNYLENITKQKKEKDNYNDYYLKSYQQSLLRANRANSYNYNKINPKSNSIYNKNVNINNNEIYQNDNTTGNYNQNYNNINNINRNNNTQNNIKNKRSMKYYFNNNIYSDNDNKKNEPKINNYMNINNNLSKNKLLLNNYNNGNNYFNKDKNSDKNIQNDNEKETFKTIENKKYIMNTESHLYNPQNNYNINEIIDDNNNYHNYLKRNTNRQQNQNINYFNNKNINNKIPEEKDNIKNKTISNDELIKKQRYNFPRYYINKEGNNKINLPDATSNNDSLNYRKQRINTEIEKNKYKSDIKNNIKVKEINSNYNNLRNYKKDNYTNKYIYHDKTNYIIKTESHKNLGFKNNNNDMNNDLKNDYYNYLQSFNESSVRDLTQQKNRIIKNIDSNMIHSDIYNLYKNFGNDRIIGNYDTLNERKNINVDNNFNNLNINNCNYYNTLIDNKNNNNNDKFYDNNEIEDENNEIIKKMNRSSSYFHPRKTFNTVFNLDNRDKNQDNNYKLSPYIKENEFRNNNIYNNYNEKNKYNNSFIPNTINRTNSLKSKFFNNIEYDDYH